MLQALALHLTLSRDAAFVAGALRHVPA